MATWLVTVKLPKGHAGPHDPKNKVTGPCPLAPNALCTDQTGEHHTAIWLAEQLEDVVTRTEAEGLHLTRAEQVVLPEPSELERS